MAPVFGNLCEDNSHVQVSVVSLSLNFFIAIILLCGEKKIDLEMALFIYTTPQDTKS
jgi:hypothetical protein